MKQLLEHTGRTQEDYEIICIIQSDLRDWKEPRGREDSKRLLETVRARVITYDELIGNARRAYSEYLDASFNAKRIHKVIEAIESSLTDE